MFSRPATMTNVLPYSYDAAVTTPWPIPRSLATKNGQPLPSAAMAASPTSGCATSNGKMRPFSHRPTREHQRNRDEKDRALLTTSLPHVPGTGNEPGDDGDRAWDGWTARDRRQWPAQAVKFTPGLARPPPRRPRPRRRQAAPRAAREPGCPDPTRQPKRSRPRPASGWRPVIDERSHLARPTRRPRRRTAAATRQRASSRSPLRRRRRTAPGIGRRPEAWRR